MSNLYEIVKHFVILNRNNNKHIITFIIIKSNNTYSNTYACFGFYDSPYGFKKISIPLQHKIMWKAFESLIIYFCNIYDKKINISDKDTFKSVIYKLFPKNEHILINKHNVGGTK